MEEKFMGLLENVNNKIWPIVCDDCKRSLEKKEFIAVIGKTPSTGLSVPVGRTDVIFKKVGQIHCEQCFKKRYESR
jgi:hypothetical protein